MLLLLLLLQGPKKFGSEKVLPSATAPSSKQFQLQPLQRFQCSQSPHPRPAVQWWGSLPVSHFYPRLRSTADFPANPLPQP
ncbi:hypothetical protein K456DRAFT_44390 [Colletotrichum gloeosporioides 23]|nr:hypothetical protein K456DRAFT_44390 [Colletotrichum gloeosporioides 23]